MIFNWLLNTVSHYSFDLPRHTRRRSNYSDSDDVTSASRLLQVEGAIRWKIALSALSAQASKPTAGTVVNQRRPHSVDLRRGTSGLRQAESDKTFNGNLYFICCGICSQWSSCRSGITWSCFRAKKNTWVVWGICEGQYIAYELYNMRIQSKVVQTRAVRAGDHSGPSSNNHVYRKR